MLEHHYGPNVHVLDDPYLLTLLAKLGAPETGTDAVPDLVRVAYRRLFQEVVSREFPVVPTRRATRMTASEPRAAYDGPGLCPTTKLVVCAVIRAGILPAQVCYETAAVVLPPGNVRLDFLNMSRQVDESHRVVGVRLDGSKIGGPAAGGILLLPDPMGATGATICKAVEVYSELTGGPPAKVVALHLMVTPEALRRVTRELPTAKVYAARLDRGLSSPEVLASPPGLHWDKERGLNDVHYVVPGAGGLGELLTNSWI